ncbi:MAG: hypothetical protein KC561_10310, partial [Myxococcales bacterium]|nr:hypothetical protein [Myxococcales bacterium]
DIDFFLRTSPQNARRVVEALAEFGFAGAFEEADFLDSTRLVQLGNPPNRIDLMTTISGVDFDSAWAGRVEAKLGEVGVPLIGLPELLINKRASGRSKDLVDLEVLDASRSKD